MRYLPLLPTIIISFLIFLGACQKDQDAPQIPQEDFLITDIENVNLAGDICSRPYEISLVRKRQRLDGTWEWIWGVKNPNPGDGTNGTLKDLSSWAITLPTCVQPSNIKASFAFVIHGPAQYHTQFTPTYQRTSLFKDCQNTGLDYTNGQPVLVFNFGTRGNVITYYELVLDKDYSIDKNGLSFFKTNCSGSGTGGAGQSCFPGVGCALTP